MTRGGATWVAALLGCVLLQWVTQVGAAPPPSTSLGAERALSWGPLGVARVFRWEDQRGPALSVREVSGDEAVPLAPEELLAVPVRPGQMLRTRGCLARVGFGSGTGQLPDVIVWRPDLAAGRIFRVPTWNSARFVVFGCPSGSFGTLGVDLSTENRSGLAWHRFDRSVAAWIRASVPEAGAKPAGAALPQAFPVVMPLPLPAADALPILRALESAREALAPTETAGLREWLLLRWLTESSRVRPLAAPYFSARSVELAGGSSKPTPLPASQEDRLVEEGQRLTLRAPDADVVALLLRARAVGTTRVVIREGRRLLQEVRLRVPLHNEDPARFTPPERIRALPQNGVVTVEVLEGLVWVRARAYQQRDDLIDIFDGDRSRAQQLSAALQAPENGLVQLLTRAEYRPSAATNRALEARAARDNLSPGVRALLWAELFRDAEDTADLSPLAWAWHFSGALPSRLSLSVRNQLLQVALDRFADALDEHPKGKDLRLPLDEAATSDELAVEVADKLALLLPPRNRQRSARAAQAETAAAALPGHSGVVKRARALWRRLTPWAGLAATPGTPVRADMQLPRDPLANGSCRVHGPRGLRWSRVSDATRTFRVEAGVGTHADVWIRADSKELSADALLTIDDVPVSVHAGAGFAGHVAVAPGVHRFARAAGGPLLIRLPREEVVPCDTLREEQRWAVIAAQAGFALPTGAADSVLSVVVAGSSVPKATSLRLRLGSDEYEAWVRAPATGMLELPVAARASSLLISSTTRALVRARLRLQPGALATVLDHPRPVLIPREEDRFLAGLRSATQGLREAKSTLQATTWRLKRTVFLDALGYPRLANVDRVRAGRAPREALPSASTYALVLPPGNPQVLPLGFLSRIPPLALPTAPTERAALAQAIESDRAGAAPPEILTRLDFAKQTTDAAALLRAVVAERAGRLQEAALAYERIGRAHASGEALARAAEYRTALLPAQAVDLGEVLRTYVLLRESVELGADAGRLLARYAPAIRWERAPEPLVRAGLVQVESEPVGHPGLPLADRVRRALTDAPARARLSSGQSLSFPLTRLRPSALELEVLCHAFDGAEEGCGFWLSLDERPVQCASEPAPPSGATTRAISRPVACRIDIPAGARALVVTPPPEHDAVLWVAAAARVAGELVPFNVQSGWAEVDAGRPYSIDVQGPGVLRIDARAPAGALRELRIARRLTRSESAVSDRRVWSLDAGHDPFALRLPQREPLGWTQDHYVVLPENALYSVSIDSPKGPTLLHVSSASAAQAPRASEPSVASRLTLPLPAKTQRSVQHYPTLLEPAAPGLLTLGGVLKLVDSNVADADEDARSRYLEVALSAERQLWPDRWWLRASGFSRVRRGAESYGAELWTSFGEKDGLPGGFLSANLVTQSLAARSALGASVTAGVFRSWLLSADWKLTPGAVFKAYAIDEEGAYHSDADPDVYSLYKSTRSRQLSALVDLRYRPLVDTLIDVGTQLRLGANLDNVDRADLHAGVQTLPGAGFTPWLEFEAVTSLRPITELRRRTFVRNTLVPAFTFWHWLSDSQRITFGGRAAYLFDWPIDSGHPTQLSGELTLGYAWSQHRGLRDSSAAQRPYPDRLEQGRSWQALEPAPVDLYWRDQALGAQSQELGVEDEPAVVEPGDGD